MDLNSTNMETQPTETKGGSQVQVRFHTRQQRYAVTDTPILVPARLRRYGLSEIVNHLLASAKPVPFDFLIEGKFLRSSLQQYLDSNGLSTENMLDVEYMESTLPPTQTATYQHDDWVAAVKAHKTTPYICTGSYDSHARIWNKTGDCVAVLQAHTAAVKSVAWIESSAEDQRLRCLSGGLDQKIYAWEYLPEEQKSRILYSCAEQSGSIESIAVNSHGTNFASASYKGPIHVWTTSEEDVDEVNQDSEEVDVARKRRRLNDRAVPVKRPTAILEGHVGAVSSVVYNKHGGNESTLFSGGLDHSVRVWDIEGQSNTHTMNCEVVILDVDHSVHSGLLVSGHADNLLRLWDPRVQDGLVVKLKLASHTNWVSTVSWSPTSMYTLASGSYDSTIKVWDIRSTTPLYSLAGATEDNQKVLSVDWADGLIYSGGEDSLLRVHTCKS